PAPPWWWRRTTSSAAAPSAICTSASAKAARWEPSPRSPREPPRRASSRGRRVRERRAPPRGAEPRRRARRLARGAKRPAPRVAGARQAQRHRLLRVDDAVDVLVRGGAGVGAAGAARWRLLVAGHLLGERF